MVISAALEKSIFFLELAEVGQVSPGLPHHPYRGAFCSFSAQGS
jgi:hypothetical protein